MIPPAPLEATLLGDGKPKADDTKNETHELAREFRTAEKWVIGTNIILAIVGVFALCIYHGQLDVMRDQLGEIIKQYPELQKSAKAARDSVTNADSNFRQDERAWMAFKFMEGNLTLTIGKSFLVPTELVNTGKTPAKNVHGNIVVGVFKKGETLDFTYTLGHANYGIRAGTIFPTGKIMESFEGIKHGRKQAEPIIFTAPLKDELFNAHSFIIVHGKIIYDDIFGIEHWTTYCRYVLHPELISEQCTRYNDTDDNKW